MKPYGKAHRHGPRLEGHQNCSICNEVKPPNKKRARAAGAKDLRGRLDLSLEERMELQSKLDPETGCILMTKKPCNSGYVQIKVNGKLKMAHRVAFELAGGVLGPDQEIDHTCVNPTCVNPEHLRAVTHSENMFKAFERGGGPRNTSGPKLNREKVNEIRKLYKAGGVTHEELAEMFGVSRSSITGILNFRRWT